MIGLEIMRAGDNGMRITGSNNIVEGCSFHDNSDTGLQLDNGAAFNQVINCDSYNNRDPGQGNADGFAAKLGVGTGNSFTGCRSWFNSDDGWDLYGQPYPVTMTSCTATNNGYGSNGDGNGFKLGKSGQSVPHSVLGCTSSSNLGCGYDGNGNTGHITTTGSGGSGNGKGLWCRIY